MSSICDENKTHHLDGLPGIETVLSTLAGEGEKKKKKVENFRGRTLWGTSLSAGCIHAGSAVGDERRSILGTFKIGVQNNINDIGYLMPFNV